MQDGRIHLVLMSAGTFIAGAGGVLVIWANAELAGGLAEFPQHWWSALAAVVLITGLVVAAIGVKGLRPTPSNKRLS